jgi:CHASE2 domain-containing sensor protein
MNEPDDGGRAALRAFGVTAVALAGLLFSLTPAATSLDDGLLDREWRLLRQFAPHSAPDDIIVVGIDPASVGAITEPPPMWHEPLGAALAKIASAKPRAIGLDFPLPERSYESIRAGLDRALFVGLAAAAENGPFVAVLNIDARTRSARRIHTPFLALLGDARLSVGLLARDGDGVTRRFSLLIPTEDGGFPTLAGRLCHALSQRCSDGLIDYSLGPQFRYIPFSSVLEMRDPAALARAFRDRIVLIGETQPYTDRIEVPFNMAGWEPAARDSPAIVVHAQALRTAILGAAPDEASRPLVVMLLSVASLLVLVRDWRLAFLCATIAAVAVLVAALVSLHGGLYVPMASVLFTLAVAWIARVALTWRDRRRPVVPNIPHSR